MKQLRRLNLRDNRLSKVPGVVNVLSSLEVLDLSFNDIRKLNEFTVLNESFFQFLPALTHLDLSDNPLTCDCSNSGFMLWVLSSSQTQLVNGYHQTCTYPSAKRE
ncbi:hypothetical protein NHX12_009782 [Muraenolepis orangiensis]|uniref:Uncharacterized protein n=1 Tax=Muraenolepis orangiensis TaxID=630683 RepID=A0A9Q0DIA8_9TELE|nr:hypothetical protein NHX12_009782 [Muraenolepis orangiensis]